MTILLTYGSKIYWQCTELTGTYECPTLLHRLSVTGFTFRDGLKRVGNILHGTPHARLPFGDSAEYLPFCGLLFFEQFRTFVTAHYIDLWLWSVNQFLQMSWSTTRIVKIWSNGSLQSVFVGPKWGVILMYKYTCLEPVGMRYGQGWSAGHKTIYIYRERVCVCGVI